MTREEWDSERYSLEIEKVITAIESIPPGSVSLANLRDLIAHFPLSLRVTTLALMQSILHASDLGGRKLKYDLVRDLEGQRSMAVQRKEEGRRETRAFWVGLVLFLIALIFSIVLPAEKVTQAGTYLRICAGVGAGMMIAFLPGLFRLDSEINVKRNKVVIRATGGFAAIVMIYFFDPGWISSLLSLHMH